jgi:hypothetical protein
LKEASDYNIEAGHTEKDKEEVVASMVNRGCIAYKLVAVVVAYNNIAYIVDVVVVVKNEVEEVVDKLKEDRLKEAGKLRDTVEDKQQMDVSRVVVAGRLQMGTVVFRVVGQLKVAVLALLAVLFVVFVQFLVVDQFG